MDATTIIQIVTLAVTLLLGIISKKHPSINNKMIPIQNLCIGIISSVIYYFITKDINLVIVAIGVGAGGAYDLIKNTYELLKDKEWFQKLIGKETISNEK